jgi:alpha-L-glutamate ligase-like protein
MFETFLNARKILGMNARNLDYIRPFNRKQAKKIADNKLLSKKILRKGGIPVPNLISKISTVEELENFNWQGLPSSFALKPNNGFGGGGIVVVYGRKKNRDDAWVKADGSILTIEDIKNHIRNILDGSFSISNSPDIAFFEQRLTLLKLFKPYAYKGIPDIRVIVFNKVPVMAMLRLPTKESGGKANLHQGAIGVGIDLATGVTTTAVSGIGKIVDYVPNTRMLLSGIRIPYWKEILRLAVKSQEVTGMGFLGADVAIDRELGPVFLEINARPGLAIQIANLSGLKERLERVKGLKIKSNDRGVRMGMDLFGGEVEEEVEDISGRKVIGTIEKIKVIGKDGKELEVEAKIDTGAGFTSIDTELAEKLGFESVVELIKKENINFEDIKNLSPLERESIFRKNPAVVGTAIINSSHGTSYRPIVMTKIIMDGIELSAKTTIIDRSNLKYSIIIGKKNLGKFLIDVNK